MKQLILNNWKTKLGSVFLAMAIWYLIKSHVERLKPPTSYPVPGQGALPADSPDLRGMGFQPMDPHTSPRLTA